MVVAAWEVLFDSAGDGLTSATTEDGTVTRVGGQYANFQSALITEDLVWEELDFENWEDIDYINWEDWGKKGRIRLSNANGLLASDVGGLVIAFEPLNASTYDADLHYLFDWIEDANNWIKVYYNGTGDVLTLLVREGGVTESVSTDALTFSAGDDLVAVIGWDATTLYVALSVNGAAIASFATAARARSAPTMTVTTLDIGSQADGAHLNGAIAFVELLTVVPTVAEASQRAEATRPPLRGETFGSSQGGLWLGADSTYYDDPDDILTADIREMVFSHGRDYPSTALGRAVAGDFSAQLVNDDGRYSPSNTGSPLSGNLVPGRLLRVRAADATQHYARWSGFTFGSPQPSYAGDALYTAQLQARGPLFWLAGAGEISVVGAADVASGTALGTVLDAASWAAADRTIDAGQETFAVHFDDDINALTASHDIEASEGPGAFLRESSDGKIVFEDRHHRLKSDHVSSQETFEMAIDATFPIAGEVDQLDPLAEIFNRVTIELPSYSSPAALAVVWQHAGDDPTVGPGDNKDFVARYPNPGDTTGAYIDAWTTPDNTDITVTGAAWGDLTVTVTKRAREMVINVANGGSVTATLTLLRARGTAVTYNDPTRLFVEDATSQTTYGLRELPLRPRFLSNENSALAFAQASIARQKDPVPLLHVPVRPRDSAAMLTAVLGLEVSERITIVDQATPIGIGAGLDVFIEKIREYVALGGAIHKVDYDCSSAEGGDGAWIVLNTGPGLNTGQVAY